jgi:hypothetical protein
MKDIMLALVLFLLLCFSVINLVLTEIVKNNNNQELNPDVFLTIGESISGISLIFIFCMILKNLYPWKV